MKTLLRKISTGLYFKGPDCWTSDPTQAKDFRMIDRALDFIRKWRLKDVEVAFAFRSDGSVQTVPPDKIGLNYSES